MEMPHREQLKTASFQFLYLYSGFLQICLWNFWSGFENLLLHFELSTRSHAEAKKSNECHIDKNFYATEQRREVLKKTQIKPYISFPSYQVIILTLMKDKQGCFGCGLKMYSSLLVEHRSP